MDTMLSGQRQRAGYTEFTLKKTDTGKGSNVPR